MHEHDPSNKGGIVLFQSPVLTQSTVDGATLTAAAAASCIPAGNVVTIPPNWWEVGKRMIIRVRGRMSSVITTPGTARFDIRMGAVVAWDSLAMLLDTVAAHVTKPFALDIELVCRSIGAGTAATLFGFGVFHSENLLGVPAAQPTANASAMLPWGATPAVGTGFDSTVSNAVNCFFTQTVATGSMTVHDYAIHVPGVNPGTGKLT